MWERHLEGRILYVGRNLVFLYSLPLLLLFKKWRIMGDNSPKCWNILEKQKEADHHYKEKKKKLFKT